MGLRGIRGKDFGDTEDQLAGISFGLIPQASFYEAQPVNFYKFFQKNYMFTDFFHLCFFAEGKKTSVDGLKWRDLVVVVVVVVGKWWWWCHKGFYV